MIKDDEGAQNLEGIRHKLSQDNLENIKNIHNERMKRKSEINIKKHLIHGHMVGWTGCHSVLQPWDINMEVIRELVLISKPKDFGLSHYRDLSHQADQNNLQAARALCPKTFSEGEDFHLLQILGTPLLWRQIPSPRTFSKGDFHLLWTLGTPLLWRQISRPLEPRNVADQVTHILGRHFLGERGKGPRKKNFKKSMENPLPRSKMKAKGERKRKAATRKEEGPIRALKNIFKMKGR